MRREERGTVQGPVKEQQPNGMSHRGPGNRHFQFSKLPSKFGYRASPLCVCWLDKVVLLVHCRGGGGCIFLASVLPSVFLSFWQTMDRCVPCGAANAAAADVDMTPELTAVYFKVLASKALHCTPHHAEHFSVSQCQPRMSIPVAIVEHVQLFKVKCSKRKWYTVHGPVSQ